MHKKGYSYTIFIRGSNEYEHKHTNRTNPAYRTTRIINVSAILFSCDERQVAHNNTSKFYSCLNKVTILFSSALRLCQLRLYSMNYQDVCQISKPGYWYIYIIFTGGPAAQQQIRLSNFRAIGVFHINTPASILQDLEANCLNTSTAPQGGTKKMAPGPIPANQPRTPTSVPLPPAMVETHNMKTL